VAPEYLRNVIRIVTETGLRIYKELTPMKKDQLDLVNRTVWIPAFKTPNGVMEDPLTDIAVAAFTKQLVISGPGAYLFPSDANAGDSGRGRGITAVISHSANDRLRCAAKQRGCTVTALANSALRQWLGEKHAAYCGSDRRNRVIGLVASFFALAAIGLTLVADRGLPGAGGLGTRPERTFLLAVAGVLCVANLVLVCTHRAKARRANETQGRRTSRGGVHAVRDDATGSAND
jgi:hypothetical protein